MSPARDATPSCRMFAPSLMTAVMVRSTISSLAIERRVMPRFIAAAAAMSSTVGSTIGLRLPAS
jgi:hypothetical protein